MTNIAKTQDRNNLMKYYSFDFSTMGSPSDFTNIQIIQGLKSSVSEMVDAIENRYIPFSLGKKYLYQLINTHNDFVYEIDSGGSGGLLYYDEVILRIKSQHEINEDQT